MGMATTSKLPRIAASSVAVFMVYRRLPLSLVAHDAVRDRTRLSCFVAHGNPRLSIIGRRSTVLSPARTRGSISRRTANSRSRLIMTQRDSASGAATQLLLAWSAGDREALDQMLPLVYDELHRLAVHDLSHERADHTLQPTALVNEAYLRLVNQRDVDWRNRAQFLGVAAGMMRRILVNHARDRVAAKRGGEREQVSLSLVEVPSGGP